EESLLCEIYESSTTEKQKIDTKEGGCQGTPLLNSTPDNKAVCFRAIKREHKLEICERISDSEKSTDCVEGFDEILKSHVNWISMLISLIQQLA
ncbi:hypothetical protein SK128_016105, partial [Halocaridina rubra]